MPSLHQPRRKAAIVEPLEHRIAPATFVVNLNGDAPDANPGDGLADSDLGTPGLQTTLRAAMMEANALVNSGGPDVISFAGIPVGGNFTIQPASPLPAIVEAVVIDGYTAPNTSVNSLANGTNAVIRVAIDGSLLSGGSGLILGVSNNPTGSGGSTVRGLAIYHFGLGINDSGNAILIQSSNNTIEGNFLGTGVTGDIAGFNGNSGVSVGNIIGGGGPYLNNIIGGPTASAKNLISGNSIGISVRSSASGTVIMGNLIGTDDVGDAAIPNSNAGIRVVGAGTTIANNIISGNDGIGIGVGSTSGPTTMVGNIIGLNAAGTAALPNAQAGIRLDNDASNITIGGTAVGAGNVISGNLSTGIEIGSPVGDGPANNVTVLGNKIGTNAAGTVAFGNNRPGIAVFGSTGSKIGGTGAGEANIIAFNAEAGILLNEDAGPTSVKISGNSFRSNGGLAIDLRGGKEDFFGVNENDIDGDSDLGPNGLLNSPLLANVVNTGGNVDLDAVVTAEPNTTYTVEFYAMAPDQVDPSGTGEGFVYLGNKIVTTDGAGQAFANFSSATALPTNSYFSAVVIDNTTGATSEFSLVAGPAPGTYTWTGSISSDWFTAGNWSPNGVPGPFDIAIINSGTVKLDSTAGIAALQQSGGTLTGGGELIVRNSLSWTGGTHTALDLTLITGASGIINGTGPLTWTDGTLEVFGNLTLSGSGLAFNSGIISVGFSGSVTLNAGIFDQDGPNTATYFGNSGKVQKSGPGNFGLDVKTTENYGEMEVTQGTFVLSSFTQYGGTLSMLGGGLSSSGTLNFEGGDLSGFGTIPGNVVNNAAYVLPGGAGFGIITVNGSYTQGSGGTLVMDIGGVNPGGNLDRLAVNGPATLDGVLNVTIQPGFVPALGNSFVLVTASARTNTFQFITGEGALTPNYTSTTAELGRSGQLYTWDAGGGVDTSWNNPLNWTQNIVPGAGDVAVLDSTATITIDAGDVTVGDFIQSSGTLTGAKKLTILGGFQWSGGNQSGVGSTVASFESSTIISGTAVKSLNARVMSISGAGASLGTGAVSMGSGALFDLLGTFQVQNNAPFASAGGGGTVQIRSEALMRKTGSGVVNFPEGLNFNSNGTLEVTAGTVNLLGGGTAQLAAFQVAPGASLNFNSGSGYNLTEFVEFTGAGFVSVPGGGTLNTQDVTINVGPAVTFNVNAGVFLSTGNTDLFVDGTFTVAGGTLGGEVHAFVEGTIDMVGSANITINQWVIQVKPGANAIWTNTSNVTLGQNAQIVIEGNGEVQGSPTFVSGVGGGGITINPGGLFQVDNGFSANVQVPVTNVGFFRLVGAASLTLGAAFTQEAGGILELDGTPTLTATQSLTINGGIVAGTGTIVGSVQNVGGFMDPGPTTGTGRLTIQGDYSQSAGAQLFVEAQGLAPGSGYDQLQVTGTASLAGGIIFIPINAFTIVAPLTFNVLTAATRTGTFGNFTLPPGGTPGYTATGADVVFGAAPVTYTWDGGAGADTSWFNPLNWNLDSGVPGAGDTAILNTNQTISVNGSLASVGTFQQSNGSVEGTGTFNVGNSFLWSGGNIGVLTNLAGGSTGTVSGAATKSINLGGVLNIAGQVDWTGTGNLVMDGGQLRVQTSGVLDLKSSFDFVDPNNATSVGRVNVDGTLRKSIGAGAVNFSTSPSGGRVELTVSASGRLDIQNGTFNLLGSNHTHLGSLTVAAGALMDISGALTVNTGASSAGAGVVRIASALTVLGGVTFASGVELSPAGNITGPGVLTASGPMNWAGGTIQATVNIASGATASMTGTNSWFLPGSLIVAGTLNYPGSGSSSLRMDGGTLIVQSTGLFEFQSQGSILDPNDATATGSLVVHGVLKNSSGGLASIGGSFSTGRVTTSISGTGSVENLNGNLEFLSTFTTSGVVAAIGGNVTFADFTQNGGITSLIGGNIGGGITFNFVGGTLNGSGTITGSVNNQGATVSPGGSAAGKLTIAGSLTSTGGSLLIDLGGTTPGTTYDQVVVTGNASLAGSLTVTLINGFTPAVASNFVIVSANARSGTFSPVNGASAVTAAYTANQALLLGPPDSLIVTTESDVVNAGDGVTSLREALLFANSNPGEDEITFSIPGNSVHTIFVNSALPMITERLDILGYSQPGAIENNQFNSSNAAIKIVLSGTNAGLGVDGLVFNSDFGSVAGLVIQAFSGHGVVLHGKGNAVSGNFIGTDATGTFSIPNGGSGIYIDGPENLIGGGGTSLYNVISGNTGHGILISGAGAAQNLVISNFIGLKANGNSAVGNGQAGVHIDNAPENIIGGPGIETIDRNIIGGNAGSGIVITGLGATDTQVSGNYLGLDPTGKFAIGNTLHGVQILGGATDSIIGGALARDRNFISGNLVSGIRIEGVGTSDNTVSANYIGTNEDGNSVVGNGIDGVLISGGASLNVIGGLTAGERNLISGNTTGIQVTGAGSSNNSILGNYIGTNATGTASLGNITGISLANQSTANTIGGNFAGAGNLISGNTFRGILINSAGVTSHVLQGNRIGTDATGNLPVPNNTELHDTNGGILIISGEGNTIGGTTAGAGNIIAFNNGHGVLLPFPAAQSNSILGNSIHSNTLSGIDLGDDLFTPNDPASDADAGPNGLLNFPVIASTTFVAAGSVTVDGTIASIPNANLRIEIFGGLEPNANGVVQGRTFLGFVNVTTDGSGNAPFTLNLSNVATSAFITATSTDLALGNTSEFAPAVRAFDPQDLDVGGLTFTDGSGNTVRVKLTGPGDVKMLLQGGLPDNADIESLELSGTTLASKIEVTITKKTDGFTTVNKLFTADPRQHLGTIKFGPGVTLGDGVNDTVVDLRVTGKLKALDIARIEEFAFIKLGEELPYNVPTDTTTPDTYNNRPTINVGIVLGPGFVLEVTGDGTDGGVGGGGLGNVTFGFWEDPGFIRTTQSIGNFLVKTGNFMGVLEIDKFHLGDTTEANTGTMTIAQGSWGSSGSEIEGNVGGFQATAFLAGASITAASIGTVKMTVGDLAGTLILTDPDAPGLPTFTVNSDFVGRIISAQSIRKLNIKGDFTGTLQAPSIGSITAFSFIGTPGMTNITATLGALGLITANSGNIHDYDFVTTQAFSGIKVKLTKRTADTVGIENVHITAASIGSITVDLSADPKSTGVDLVGIRNSEFKTTATGNTKTTSGKMGNITVTLKGATGGSAIGIDNALFDSRVLADEFLVGGPASTVNSLGNITVTISGFKGDSIGLRQAEFQGDTIGITKVTVTRGKDAAATGFGVNDVDYIATHSIGALSFLGDVSATQVTDLQVMAGGKVGAVTVKAKTASLGSFVNSAVLAGQSLVLAGTDKQMKAALLGNGLGAVNLSGSLTNSKLVAGASIGAVTVGGSATDSLVLAGARLGGDFTVGDGNETYTRAAAIAAITVKGVFSRTSVVAGIATTNAIFGDADDVLAAAAGTLTQSSSIGAVVLGSGTGPNLAATLLTHNFAIQAAAIKSLKVDNGTVAKSFAAALYLASSVNELADDVVVRRLTPP